MSRPRKAATADGEALRNSIDGGELRALIERVEMITREIDGYTTDRRELYAEIKAAGYDVATVRAIIKLRATDGVKRLRMEALMDEYTTALGDLADTPLGQAGADRIREAQA